MEAAVIETTTRIVPRRVNPVTEAKLSLMRGIAAELKRRYGTQRVAADAMEMEQPQISELYNERHEEFSLAFLILLAGKLDKRVVISVT